MSNQLIKTDAGKPRLSLVPTQIIIDIAKVREYGITKYDGVFNWKDVEVERWRDAAYRHWLAYLEHPQGVDSESGLSHLAHVACNIAFLCESKSIKCKTNQTANQNTITYGKLVEITPHQNDVINRLKRYFEATPNMSALDMLGLNDVRAEDRLWAVLREELIPANTLHEFGCLYAEHALSKMTDPDPRSADAISARRKWLKGEISDVELQTARDLARDARDTAYGAAYGAAKAADWAAAMYAARSVVWVVAWEAADTAAWDEEREWQLDTLVKLLEKEDKQ